MWFSDVSVRILAICIVKCFTDVSPCCLNATVSHRSQTFAFFNYQYVLHTSFVFIIFTWLLQMLFIWHNLSGWILCVCFCPSYEFWRWDFGLCHILCERFNVDALIFSSSNSVDANILPAEFSDPGNSLLPLEFRLCRIFWWTYL